MSKALRTTGTQHIYEARFHSAGVAPTAAADVPGVATLVGDDFGPLAGGEALKDLVELAVVHLRGQVAHKDGELRPCR